MTHFTVPCFPYVQSKGGPGYAPHPILALSL